MLLCTNAAMMVIPQLFRVAVDSLQAAGPTEDLKWLALAMLIAAAASALFRVLSRVHLFYTGRDIELAIRDDFYQHLATQPRSFFESHPTGDLMSRATSDLTQVRLLVGAGVLNLANTFIAAAISIPLMMMISVKLTLISLSIFVPALYIVQRFSRRLYSSNRVQQENMGRMGSFVKESLAGAHVVRAFGIESNRARGFDEINRSYYHAAVHLAWVRSYLWRMMVAFASLGVLLALFVGADDVIAARITLGDLVALVEYLALLAWPSFALGWVISLVQRGLAALSRIGDILDIAPTITSGPERPERLSASIAVRDLTIRGLGIGSLPSSDRLTRVDVDIPAGSTLGIVGPIGAGKSTLVHAMIRDLDVPPGCVFVGERDVTTLDLDTLRGAFGFVHQTPVLFSKTIAENVAFGAPGATPEEILVALRYAAFESDLATLPRGVATPVGERGITLSGGQKQRTAIARALLLNPPILILDDALSSVDAETEATILAGLAELRRGKTNIIVAHRISAVVEADEIIVLDAGRIIERGDHDSLMREGGLYAQIARRQELERGLAELTTEKSA